MDRKDLIRQYKATPRPAGVYRIQNTETSRTLVGTSVDAPAMLNRQRAQLQMGGHPNRGLQADWDALGSGAFKFEILDSLTPSDEPGHDVVKDLQMLEELWVEKLGLSADLSY